ncbi:MAG: M56 family metallopeptidase [Pirellulales bacterium]
MNVNISVDWTELCIQWMLTCGHFLWQGLAVAIVFLIVERLAATHASTRYAMACTALLLLPVCVVLTFVLVHTSRGAIVRPIVPLNHNIAGLNDSLATRSPTMKLDSPVDDLGDSTAIPQTTGNAGDSLVAYQAAKSQQVPIIQRVRFFAPMISAAYAIAAGLLLLRMIVSLFGSFRFGNVSQRITDARFLQVVSAQAKQLKLRTVPIVATCLRASSPVVVGILWPMILLPPSLLYGLDEFQLSAILSHEMAHIRRYDLLFNLIQRVIESLLFFHPITWWLSSRVAIERENCCDDVAASHIGRLHYAQALVQMATLCLANHRSRSQALATLAADGGNLTNFGYRIRRLIDAQETPKIQVTKRSFVFCLATLALIGASYLSLAQSPQMPKEEAQLNRPSKDSLVDGIQWSTWGDRDGLLSGARLIIPEGVVQPGQSVVVEYRLKNVSKETKKFTCYVRSTWQYITLESKNRIREMGIDSSDQSLAITIEPGKEFIAPHTATIDTRGLSPGVYQVALGSAFWLPDKENPGAKTEIPHRGSIPLTIFGESNANIYSSPDSSIHWGDAINGLRLGAKFKNATNNFVVGDVVEADLWIANVSNQPIECSIRLPHPMDGWLFNVENQIGDNIMLERPPMILIFSPQEFCSLKLAPGELKALTGDRIEGSPGRFAGCSAKFEIESKKEDQNWEDYTIKGRLVTQGGNYSAIYSVMLDRPDIPGLRIELDTGNASFTVGQATVDPKAARVLDEATDKSIFWGEPVGGLRLGIRQSELARRSTILRHGEHFEYEVWIKNETDQVVRIGRDPRDLHRPVLNGDRTINVIGSGMWLSFGIPPEELAKSELILPPGHSARRFLEQYHSASIRPPGSPRGRFGSDPLLLEPGKYTVYAQVGDLKSAVEEVEIIPAARLQVRKSSQVTDKKREYAAADPSAAILSWHSGDGAKQEAMINRDHGIFIDERDVTSVESIPVEGMTDQYSIALKLRPESASWLSRRIASYSLWEDPDMVAILLDGKPLGSVRIPAPIPNDKLIIPVGLPLKQAETTMKEIQAATATAAQPKVAPPTDTTISG